MGNLDDTLGILGIGDILQNLLPDDELPRRKYLRGIGVRFFIVGSVLLFAYLLFLQDQVGILVLLIGITLLGLVIFLYADRDGREFEDIEKRKQEARVDQEEAKVGIFEERRATMRDRRRAKYGSSSTRAKDKVEPTRFESGEEENENHGTREIEYEE